MRFPRIFPLPSVKQNPARWALTLPVRAVLAPVSVGVFALLIALALPVLTIALLLIVCFGELKPGK